MPPSKSKYSHEIHPEEGMELDEFARRLNRPLYRFFDQFSQFVLLHFLMLIMILFSAGLASLPCSCAAARLFCLPRHDRQSCSWVRLYFRELRAMFRDKKLRSILLCAPFFFLLSYAVLLLILFFKLPAWLNVLCFLVGFTGIFAFISLSFYLGPLAFFFPQESDLRTFTLCLVFSLRKFLSTLVLLLCLLLLAVFSTLMPQIAFFFVCPVLPALCAARVRYFREHRR